MLLPLLLVATAQALPADTLPALHVPLLGEPVVAYASSPASPLEDSSRGGFFLLGDQLEGATYLREAPLAPERVSFHANATLPLPVNNAPGMPDHLVADPASVGFAETEIDYALDAIVDEVERGGFPGAAVAIGRWGQVAIERGVGTLDRGLGSPAVDPDYTIYDLASLTKVIATTTAVMLLVEDGKMDLDAPVVRYLPSFDGPGKDEVTIRQLLTHSSGLPAWVDTTAPTPEEALDIVLSTPLTAEPGSRVEYSDLGFVVLWEAAQATIDEPLEEMLDRRIFEPLQMWYTRFRPGESCVRCAPTLPQDGFRGVVHDPTARNLGGVAGNAGLFSTAHDLGRFAAMLANGGTLDGVRVLDESTIDLFTQRQPGAGTRALGWDTPDPDGGGAGGLIISPTAFGHTGFTGTSMWVDPVRGTWVVLLSNHTYRPTGRSHMQELRRDLNGWVTASADRATR